MFKNKTQASSLSIKEVQAGLDVWHLLASQTNLSSQSQTMSDPAWK